MYGPVPAIVIVAPAIDFALLVGRAGMGATGRNRNHIFKRGDSLWLLRRGIFATGAELPSIVGPPTIDVAKLRARAREILTAYNLDRRVSEADQLATFAYTR